MTYKDKRFVRFASIAGIDRAELPVAAEIWLEDIAASCWADRSIIKLATLLTQYIGDPDPSRLKFGALESASGLDRKQVGDTLHIMRNFGVVEDHDTTGDALRTGLNLSYLQRLRVLEVRKRFRELSSGDLPWHRTDKKAWPRTKAA